MAMEIITPVSAVEHNTLFPRYDDGQQPEWYESELYLSGQCAFGWVNNDTYGADGADGFGCTDDEYFASRASEARWLEGLNEDAYGADGADPSTPTTPAQNEGSCCKPQRRLATNRQHSRFAFGDFPAMRSRNSTSATSCSASHWLRSVS